MIPIFHLERTLLIVLYLPHASNHPLFLLSKNLSCSAYVGTAAALWPQLLLSLYFTGFEVILYYYKLGVITLVTFYKLGETVKS